MKKEIPTQDMPLSLKAANIGELMLVSFDLRDARRSDIVCCGTACAVYVRRKPARKRAGSRNASTAATQRDRI